MRGNPSAGDLVSLDLEIKATCRRNNTKRKRKILLDRTTQPIPEEPQSSESSSIFPEPTEPEVGASEADIMADGQPGRVTLEDYSSSSVSQFFTSIAWLEVQAHNITYPHSLIRLI